MAAGLPTPGSSEEHRIQLAVAADLKRAGVVGVNGGGGGGGSGGGSRVRRDQSTKTVDSAVWITKARKALLSQTLPASLS